MDLDDGLDDLLAEISEPTSPKRAKTEEDSLPGMSKHLSTNPVIIKSYSPGGTMTLYFDYRYFTCSCS